MNQTLIHTANDRVRSYREDWCLFAKEVLKVNLDEEQKAILRAVQHERMVSVRSGTSRGKDFVGAVAALCFLYLTPRWNKAGEMTKNTKVALTAPTDRQIKNIMYPEVVRLFRKSKILHGKLSGYDIQTNWKEWFLTGFKADQHNTEAWTGFHAVNTMFVVTEASGMPENVFDAIEGNLQGNSRLLIIFNPNRSTGYAAKSQKQARFKSFALNSMNATNVIEKQNIIPGQVDWEWVNDKVDAWCEPITKDQAVKENGDFEWEGRWYRPNDVFRIKVLAMFPKVDSDILIPPEWIEAANERWKTWVEQDWSMQDPLRLGSDIAGMGRDSTVDCHRYGDFVEKFDQFFTHGTFSHMEHAGRIKNTIKVNNQYSAFIDTIGEGAGVYSRLDEQNVKNINSCKASSSPTGKDITGIYEFVNMRAQAYWTLRDWLNPAHNTKACLPHDDELMEELTTIKWKFHSNGKIIIQSKDEKGGFGSSLKEELGRSPDKSDSLALTFYPSNAGLQEMNSEVIGMFG